jgi:DNA modification methylase
MFKKSHHRIIVGDCREALAAIPDQSVQTCVTSPPYWGLRDYGQGDQIGLEQTPEAYTAELVRVFREVRRVLRNDGTLWLNLGDSFHKKQLVGIPWRVAFALQADGWYLRSDIIWHKPNSMPESVTDRPAKAHEYLFLLSKSARYYYDLKAISEPASHAGSAVFLGEKSFSRGQAAGAGVRAHGNALKDHYVVKKTRNKRSVWAITTKPFSEAHFAVMPPDLVEPCILAGSKPGELVLDPFAGAGTVLLVAAQHERRSLGVEINPDYANITNERIAAWEDKDATRQAIFSELGA